MHSVWTHIQKETRSQNERNTETQRHRQSIDILLLTSDMLSPTASKIETRYGNLQQFCTSLSPHLTVDMFFCCCFLFSAFTSWTVVFVVEMTRARFVKLRHLWSDNNLYLNLKLRLYRSSVCSILTYGSEAWYLTTVVKRDLNGANSQMMSIITVKTQHQEASKKSQTFDLVK